MTISVHQSIFADQDLGLEQRDKFNQEMAQTRDRNIAIWYQQGGRFFIDWVKQNYRTWTGDRLKWEEPYQEEAYLLRGNPWISRLMEEKGSQIGFSESMVALVIFVTSKIGVPSAYGFEQRGKKYVMVGTRIQPALKYIRPVQKMIKRYHDFVGGQDIDSKEQITIAGIPITFFHAKATATNSRDRQVTSSLSSFPSCFSVLDEAEACPADTEALMIQRMGATILPSKPMRFGSTPGAEGGIVDAKVKGAKWLFQWQVKCSHCEALQFVHPFGSLLKPISVMQDDGSFEDQFVDIAGRPMDWFSHSTDQPFTALKNPKDRELKIKTAYIGCIACGKELTWEARQAGEFAHNSYPQARASVNTTPTITVKEFHDQVLAEKVPIYDWVALRLPRLASVKFDPHERIRDHVYSKNTSDTIQQGYGCPITIGIGKINYNRLLKCVGLPLPDWCEGRSPDLIVRGIDQAPGGHWFVDQEWYFPPDEKDKDLMFINAHVKLVRFGRMSGFEQLDNDVKVFNLDLIGSDMEPEQNDAAKQAKDRSPRKVSKGKFYAFDQVALKGEPWRETVRPIQKKKVKLYALDRTWGLDQVRDRVNKTLLHLPDHLVYNPKDAENLLYHYLTSEREPGKWTEPDGEPDHFFHCHNFAEAAVHVNLFGKKGGGFAASVAVVFNSDEDED